MEETICAVATPLGKSAISIIKISGKDCIEKVNKITDINLLDKKSHTINYCHIINNNEIIDEVMISIMKAPKSFTKEDIVEINSHGGIGVINKILELLLNNNIRLAEPGEFTKRAFLNGRIDLLEAESTMDLINSKTEFSSKLAINGVEGKISKLILELRKSIINLLAHIEVNIDYPEYEDEIIITTNLIKENIIKFKDELLKIYNKSKNTKIVKEGINIALIGRPNVGKSSILNHLIEENKAIVTDISGTTRDIVEGSFLLNGITINLIDTAGIRNSNNVVEKIGIKKSKELINTVDLIILILNNSEKLTKEDEELLELTKNKKRIVFINKSDLKNELIYNDINIVKGNTLDSNGLNKLKEKIIEIFNISDINQKDLTYLSSARSISILKECLDLILSIENNINSNLPVDIIEIDLKQIFELLGNIIGITFDRELIDELFSNFCLGK